MSAKGQLEFFTFAIPKTPSSSENKQSPKQRIEVILMWCPVISIVRRVHQDHYSRDFFLALPIQSVRSIQHNESHKNGRLHSPSLKVKTFCQIGAKNVVQMISCEICRYIDMNMILMVEYGTELSDALSKLWNSPRKYFFSYQFPLMLNHSNSNLSPNHNIFLPLKMS